MELGCGSSPLIQLEIAGFNYIGVDPSQDLVKIFNRKGYHNILHGYAEDMGFIKGDSAEVIISQITLSHIYNLKQVVNECRRILRKNGLIILFEPNTEREIKNRTVGSYTNYGYSKKFLSRSIKGFEMIDYFQADDKRKIVPQGPKICAVLKKI